MKNTKKETGQLSPKKNDNNETPLCWNNKEDRKILRKHRIEQLERDYNRGYLIKHKDLEKDFPKLFEWLKPISRYGNVDKTFLIFREDPHVDVVEASSDDDIPDTYHKINEVRLTIYFFTEDHKYSISVRAPYYNPDSEEFDRGYLGAIMTNRKPYAGETWTRGGDFPDGKFSKKTWDNIINKIFSYELKNLKCFD